MTWSSMATRGLTGPRRPFGGLGGFGSLAVSIPLGLSAGRPFSPLSRAISAHWAATVCSSAATLPSSSITSAFSSVGESASRSPGGAILPGNQRSARQGSEKKRAATSFAAGTARRRKLLAYNDFCKAGVQVQCDAKDPAPSKEPAPPHPGAAQLGRAFLYQEIGRRTVPYDRAGPASHGFERVNRHR